MSKKLAIIIQTLCLLCSFGRAFANDMTVDVYESGQYKGTMTVPANRYQNLANSTKGTTLTVRPQPRADAAARQQAAQDKMAEWNRQADQRRAAAQAQQDAWKRQAEQRQVAAQARMQDWKNQADQRRAAALAQQERWNQDFQRRHAAAQNGFDAWKAAR